jgi:hypothetical protein
MVIFQALKTVNVRKASSAPHGSKRDENDHGFCDQFFSADFADER